MRVADAAIVREEQIAPLRHRRHRAHHIFGLRRHAALDGLDLAVPRGGVHGFLGPNGAGKTTALRLLLGLARPTSGEMRLLDVEVPDRLPEVLGRVGAVVEAPHFVPTLSGRKNLALLARTVGAPRGAVE